MNKAIIASAVLAGVSLCYAGYRVVKDCDDVAEDVRVILHEHQFEPEPVYPDCVYISNEPYRNPSSQHNAPVGSHSEITVRDRYEAYVDPYRPEPRFPIPSMNCGAY